MAGQGLRLPLATEQQGSRVLNGRTVYCILPGGGHVLSERALSSLLFRLDCIERTIHAFMDQLLLLHVYLISS